MLTLYREPYIITTADTDASGLIFYGSVFRWADRALSGFLQANGRPLRSLLDDGFGCPIVRAEAALSIPLGLDDAVELQLGSSHIGRHSFTLAVAAVIPDGRSAVTVETTHVWAGMERADAGPPRVTKRELPVWLREILGETNPE